MIASLEQGQSSGRILGERWSDRDELLELMGRYTDMPDLPDWAILPSQVFADEVEWDFSSLGRPSVVVDLGVLAERLRKAFAGWQATHHVASAHQIRVDGDQATIQAKIRAEHWLPASETGDGPNRWLVVGCNMTTRPYAPPTAGG